MIRYGALSLFLFLVPGLAGAEEHSAQVPLERVLALANAHNRRIAAERSKIELSKAERLKAGLWPNPTLSYGGYQLVGGANTGASSQHSLLLEQPFLVFGQRRARIAAAELEIRADQARIELSLAAERARARRAFFALLGRQDQLDVLKGSLAEFERAEKIVAGRAAAGDRSRYDVARIEVEMETVRVETMNAETEVVDAAAGLAIAVGLEGWTPRASGSLQPIARGLDFATVWPIAMHRRPALSAARQNVAAARGGTALAQRERWPVPSLAVGSQLTRDASGASALFGLSLPLPLFDRNQGGVARAEAELRVAELTLQAELAEARTEVARACEVLARRTAALRTLEAGAYRRVPTLRRMAADAYREGRGGVLELLDSLRSLKEIRLTYLRQAEQVKLAEVDVIVAAGLDEQ